MRLLWFFFFQTAPSIDLGNIAANFGSLASIAVLIAHVEELVDRLWNLDGWYARMRTWGEGIVLALVGNLLQYGIFANLQLPPWFPLNITWWSAILGLGCAVAANFAFDHWDWVQMFLEKINVRVPVVDRPPTPPPDAPVK